MNVLKNKTNMIYSIFPRIIRPTVKTGPNKSVDFCDFIGYPRCKTTDRDTYDEIVNVYVYDEHFTSDSNDNSNSNVF